jgi:hypothetical protein
VKVKAEEHIHDHVEDLTDEEALEDYYEGCGARWQKLIMTLTWKKPLRITERRRHGYE